MRHPALLLSAFVVILLHSLLAAQATDPKPPQKHAKVVRLEGEIKLDGKLDEAAWQKAPANTNFAWPTGAVKRPAIPGDVQTTFRAVYDDEALYIGVRCNEPKMDELTVKAAPMRDAAMWSDDDIELFLDPVGDRTEFYQLAINTEGTQTDIYIMESGNISNKEWSGPWQAKVHKGADFWSLELRLPFGMFHNRPAKMWNDNWVFSISRTRTPDPRYYSMFSPAKGYHDIAHFGTLGPIEVDRSRYNLDVTLTDVQLLQKKVGFDVVAELVLENRGDKPFEGSLSMSILADMAKGANAGPVIPPRSSKTLTLRGASLHRPGKYPVIVKAQWTDGTPALATRADTWFNYTPITVALSSPMYRGAIYPSQTVDTVQGEVTLRLPDNLLKGAQCRVTLSSPVAADVLTVTKPIEGDTVAFEMPAAGLPVGDYSLRAEVVRENKKAKFGEDVVTAIEETLRVLPPAPAVEVRVDGENNLIVNGGPIFTRGWYGSMTFRVSQASFPEAHLPQSTNFMMGCGQFERRDLGIYTLTGVSRTIDESEAKLDQEIDDTLKARLRKKVAATWNDSQVIGYYLSDEPECRGLSPVYLKSAYEYLKQLDPYRMVLIVSRAPARYVDCCDVICPHPYLNPQRFDDGSRGFGSPRSNIRRIMGEAAEAVKGRGKVAWCMPQTFSYGGKYSVHPNVNESRWMAYSSITSGAKGLVPFIFDGYWGHWENRLAMSAVFADLTLMAEAWSMPNTAAEADSSNPNVDVVAKSYRPGKGKREHVFIVATNQGEGRQEASFTVPDLKRLRRKNLVVLREDRVIEVKPDGTFTDTFDDLGAHVYTTLEILPHLETWKALEEKVSRRHRQLRESGNLLAQPDIRWAIEEPGPPWRKPASLVDGEKNGAAWMPVYADRSQCLLIFDEPVTFARLEFWSPTMKEARLEVPDGDGWRTLHTWTEAPTQHFEWSGEAVKTSRLRIVPVKAKLTWGTWAYPEITEMGVYPKR
jgi:hypothetical protein